MVLAATAGVLRRLEHIHHLQGCKDTNGPRWWAASRGDWNTDIEGCIGELVLARFLNAYWSPGLTGDRDFRRGIEVRATSWQNGCLILHNEDADDRPFVLITLSLNEGRIRGWLFGLEGKRPEYWRDDRKSAAYFVPQEALRSPDLLLQLVDDPKWASELYSSIRKLQPGREQA